jgi:hypothetical protein
MSVYVTPQGVAFPSPLNDIPRPVIDQLRLSEPTEHWPEFQQKMTALMLKRAPNIPLRPVFHVMDTDDTNACAFRTDDGRDHIALSRGFVKKAKNEAWIGYGLGHELSHPTFQDRYQIDYNNRLQEDFCDLNSMDMMIAASEPPEEAAAFIQDLYLTEREKGKDVDRNDLFDDHSPLANRHRIAEGHVAEKKSGGDFNGKSDPVNPVPAELINHAAESVHHSSWEIIKREQNFDQLDLLARLSLIRQQFDQPNSQLLVAAINEIGQLKFDPADQAHARAIDQTVNDYLKFEIKFNPKWDKKEIHIRQASNLLYQKCLDSLGLDMAPLGPFKKYQQALDTFTQAKNSSAIDAAAKDLLEINAELLPYLTDIRATISVKGEKLWVEQPGISPPQLTGLVGFRNVSKQILENNGAITPPWQPHIDAMQQTRTASAPENEQTNTRIHQGLSLCGVDNDRRIYEASGALQRKLPKSPVWSLCCDDKESNPQLELANLKLYYQNKNRGYHSEIKGNHQILNMQLKAIMPQPAEFPELHQEALEFDNFFRRRKSLQEVKPIEEVTTFEELQTHVRARLPDYQIKGANRTASTNYWDPPENAVVTPAHYEAHQKIIGAIQTIQKNYRSEDPILKTPAHLMYDKDLNPFFNDLKAFLHEREDSKKNPNAFMECLDISEQRKDSVRDKAPELWKLQRLYVDYFMGFDPPNNDLYPDERRHLLRDLHPDYCAIGEEKKILAALGMNIPDDLPAQIIEIEQLQKLANQERLHERMSDVDFLKIRNPSWQYFESQTINAMTERRLYWSIRSPDSIATEEERHEYINNGPNDEVTRFLAGEKGFYAKRIQSPYDVRFEGILYEEMRVNKDRLYDEIDRQLNVCESEKTGVPAEFLKLPAERLLDHIFHLDSSGFLADKPFLQKQMSETALNIINSELDIAKRYQLFRQMVMLPTDSHGMPQQLQTPELKKLLVQGWADCIKDQVGIDHPENTNFQRATVYIDSVANHFSKNMGERVQLLETLSWTLEAQARTCDYIKAKVDFSREDNRPLGLVLKGVDEMIEQCEKDPVVRKATLDFLSNRYSRTGSADFVNAVYNASEDARKKLHGILSRNIPSHRRGPEGLNPDDVKALSHLFTAQMHNQFWALSLKYRAALLGNIIVSPSQSIDPETSQSAFAVATQEVLDQTMPANEGDRDTEMARDIIRAFTEAAETNTERAIILGALMSAQQSGGPKKSVGEILALVLSDMGPAYVKLGQAIASHPDTPESIRIPLQKLKSNADLPPLWDIWSHMKNVIPPGTCERIYHLGHAEGWASVNIALNCTFLQDGIEVGKTQYQPENLSDEMLVLQRENAKNRADFGFDHMRRTVDLLRHSDLVKIKPTFLEMVDESKSLTHEELADSETKAKQIENFYAAYNGQQIAVGKETFHVRAVNVYEVGDEYMRQEKAKGVSFNRLPNDDYKVALGEGLHFLEERKILAGQAFGYDRHGGQLNVDRQTNTVLLFDPLDMPVEKPTGEQIAQVARFFGRLARANLVTRFLGKTQDDLSLKILNESIEKERQAGNSPAYLMKLRKAALNRNDFKAVISPEQLEEFNRQLIFSADVHPVIAAKIRQGLFYTEARGSAWQAIRKTLLKHFKIAGEVDQAIDQIRHGAANPSVIIQPGNATHATPKVTPQNIKPSGNEPENGHSPPISTNPAHFVYKTTFTTSEGTPPGIEIVPLATFTLDSRTGVRPRLTHYHAKPNPSDQPSISRLAREETTASRL